MPEAREAGAPAAPPRPADGAGTHIPGPRGAAPAAPAAASSGSASQRPARASSSAAASSTAAWTS
ncbi:mannose-binding protein, partial [Actinacidiphila glaucinigra]